MRNLYFCSVRVKLRNQFAKLDNKLFEMALESAGFDETRARALLGNLAQQSSDKPNGSSVSRVCILQTAY